MTKSALPDGWLTGGKGAACGLALVAFADIGRAGLVLIFR